jgi:hypothetical protein
MYHIYIKTYNEAYLRFCRHEVSILNPTSKHKSNENT